MKKYFNKKQKKKKGKTGQIKSIKKTVGLSGLKFLVKEQRVSDEIQKSKATNMLLIRNPAQKAAWQVSDHQTPRPAVRGSARRTRRQEVRACVRT